VFQSFNLVPLLNVVENVGLPFDRGPGSAIGELRRVRDAIALVELTGKSATGLSSCPPASSSASRSPARSSPARPCCSPTSRPATSTSRPASTSSMRCGGRA
jgi:hypothetical protein